MSFTFLFLLAKSCARVSRQILMIWFRFKRLLAEGPETLFAPLRSITFSCLFCTSYYKTALTRQI